MSYYEREEYFDEDGNKVFITDDDKANQEGVAEFLGRMWKCKFHSYGSLCAIDYWVERNGAIVAHVEIKSRSHPQDQYPTVFLNMRKWLALTLAEVSSGIPSIYVVKFTDAIKHIRVCEVDVKDAIKVGGTKYIVKAKTDIEPVICIPVSHMKSVVEV